MLERCNNQLILNDQKIRIGAKKKKTPICGRGFSETTIEKSGPLVECAHHYIRLEIYFNSFSEKISENFPLVVSITNCMENCYV
jgi:hypothetical protein